MNAWLHCICQLLNSEDEDCNQAVLVHKGPLNSIAQKLHALCAHDGSSKMYNKARTFGKPICCSGNSGILCHANLLGSFFRGFLSLCTHCVERVIHDSGQGFHLGAD